MDIIIPLLIVTFITVGLIRKVKIFDAFLTGAKEGLTTVFLIAPTMIALVTAVSMLRASTATDLLSEFISPMAQRLGFPAEILPAALLRPISGSGSTALLLSVFKEQGPDSFAGKVMSVMAGSTETTVYAIAMYYGATGIKKARHTLASGLCADFTAFVFSVLTTRLFSL